jgi:hypothetical protein
VHIAPGTYTATASIVIYSYLQLIGSGVGNTLLTLAPGVNSDVIQSANVDGWAGSGLLEGMTQFAIRDLTIDGNKGAQTKGSGIRVYAYDFDIANIRVRNCHDHGISSEWGPGDRYDPDAMEARVNDLKVHDNGGDGVAWNGPHDSAFSQVNSYFNDGNGVTVGPNGAGLLAVNCHHWGNNQPYAWVLNGQTSLVNCTAEGASVAQILINADQCQIDSGMIYSAGLGALTGVVLGTPGRQVAMTRIDTKFIGCNDGCVKLVNERNSVIKLHTWQAKNSAIVGTPHPYTSLEVMDGGNDARVRYANGTRLELPGHVLTTNGYGGTSASPGPSAGGGAVATIGGNDIAGYLTVKAGGSGLAGNAAALKVAYARPYPQNAIVTLTPANAAAAGLVAWVEPGTAGFQVMAKKMVAGASYAWMYQVVGIAQ